MTKLQQVAGDHVVRRAIPAQATAGTPNTWAAFTAPQNITIVGVKWVPDAAVTGAATNNFALQLKAGATGLTQVKTYDNGTNSAAVTAEGLTLTATEADLNVASGAVVHLARTVNGTGLASPSGTLEVTYRLRGV